MGYYTNFTLGTVSPNVKISDILKSHTEEEFKGLYFAVDENGYCKRGVKWWYDYEEDMRRLSRLHPDVVFKLHGEGEAYDDIWDKYFKNGKMQACYIEIVTNIDDYDESKLE